MRIISSSSALQKNLNNVHSLEMTPQSWSVGINQIILYFGRIGKVTIPCIKAPIQHDNVSGGAFHAEKWNKLREWLTTIPEQNIAVSINEDSIEVTSPNIKEPATF
jgi:hypothetical protein